MMLQTYPLDLITPGLCGGVRPEKQAEIRASSIRGVMRWWFRALGGFKSLAPATLAEQEILIFGCSGWGMAQAGRMLVRVKSANPDRLRSTSSRNAGQLKAFPGTEREYLLFPLIKRSRAVFDAGRLPGFELEIGWRGRSGLWPDIQALATVFGHLGALGFRSRRAMGALAFRGTAPDLGQALAAFSGAGQLAIKALPAQDAAHAISVLAKWLRKWRSSERNRRAEVVSLGRQDHDAGLNQHQGPVYRPALGLPIDQIFSHSQHTVYWDESYHPKQQTGSGRFASPVLLRPCRQAGSRWLALVIFADAHRWPQDKKVFINGRPRAVALDLYEAMKNDPQLIPFQP